MTKHEPNNPREATTRSPAPSSAARAVNTADMPDAVAVHASAPSRAASRFCSIAVVGLPYRL